MDLILGIICGIVLSLFFSFGPAFFSLIQTSIQQGYRRAMMFPLGVFASDAIVVFLMLTILKDVDMNTIIRNPYVATIGGIGMIVMGVLTFRKKVSEPTRKQSRIKFRNTNRSSRKSIFIYGFLVNFFNPLIWVCWLAVVAFVSGDIISDDMTPSIRLLHMYLFFGGLLATTLGLDILKCKLSSMLQRVITAKVLNLFNKITGCIFFIFAAYLIISMLVYQLNPKAREQQQDPGQKKIQVIKKINNGLHDSTYKF